MISTPEKDLVHPRARIMWRAQPDGLESIGSSWTMENVGEMQLALILAPIVWSLSGLCQGALEGETCDFMENSLSKSSI